MSPAEASLTRARLHIRAGKRRLRQGKISAGIVTLYDALTYAIDWYLSDTSHQENLIVKEGERITNDSQAFAILHRSGVLGKDVDPHEMDKVFETALDSDMHDYDYSGFLKSIESAMTYLGVMPFDEATLPSEDPKTF